VQRSDLISLFLVATGINRHYGQHMAGPGFPILAYHEVRGKTLASHLKALAPYYRFMSLEDALDYQAPQDSRPPIVLTFDDGYKSWLTEAVPVLRKKRIPALFLPTLAFVERKQLPWYEVVDRFVRRRRGTELVVGDERFVVRTVARDPSARRSLHQRLKAMDHSELMAVVQRLEAQLEPDDRRIIQEKYLTVDELRSLPGPLFEVGSHTLTHPILTRIPAEQVRAEVSDSRTALEALLDRPVRYFAYPNGLADDMNEAVVSEVRRAGYSAGLTALSGWNASGIDQMRLRRGVVAADGSLWRLRATATGLLGLLEELWSWRRVGL